MKDRPGSDWPSRLEWTIILAFWGTLAVLAMGQGGFQLVTNERGAIDWGYVAGECTEYLIWTLITPLIFRLVAAFPPVARGADSRMGVVWNGGLHVGLAFVVAITIDFGEEIGEMVLQGEQVSFLQQVQQFWFVNELVIYLVILMAGFARSYYFQQKARQKEAERLEARAEALEAQLTEARLEALRMQLNPHFLFNTLHAVSTLVDQDPAGVRRMIARLSELLRHVLDEEAPQEVPLSEELTFLDGYLEIQSIRFQGRLDTEVDVPSSLYDAQVPNLILQPIVENAIKHGASKVRGVGHIAVRARREDEVLVLTVVDNGPGLSEGQEDGFGLRNVRARLQELYGHDQSFRLVATEKGTQAVLRLPYHTSESLYTATSAPTPTAPAPDGTH